MLNFLYFLHFLWVFLAYIKKKQYLCISKLKNKLTPKSRNGNKVMITINDFKNACKNASTVNEINESITNLGKLYKMNIENEPWDDTDAAAAFFESDEVITKELGQFTIYLEPDDESNVLLEENGDVYAIEEKEVLVSVFESYLDPASDDYFYTYTIHVNGEREF